MGEVTGRQRSRLLLALGVAAVTAGLAAMPAEASTTMVSACDEASLASALSHGGTVEYANDCNVSFTHTLTITNVDLEGNGHTVTFTGGGVRLFKITSGTVTIGGITLTGASVTGAPGKAGSPGIAGHGGAAGCGGAIWIGGSAQVTLSNDTFSFDAAEG